MGAFDILFGIPDARARLAASLGQGPGQPGNAAGPQPLAGPQAAPQGPPNGGAGAGPPTGAAPGGAPAGPPQGQPAAPPQPQAYQSPPDLVSMYMQLAQRQQASDQFSRGLGLLAASTYPGRHPEMITNAMSGGQQDPGAMFNNILQLQQYSQQQSRYADMVNNPDKYAKSLNMDPDLFKATVLAGGPQAASEFITKVAEAQAGVGGGPAWMAQQRAEKALTAQGKPIPWTPGDPSSYDAYTKAQTAQSVTTSKTKADDLVADQHNFAPALANYDKTLGLVDQFMKPDMQEAAKQFLGPGGELKGEGGVLTPEGKEAWALYSQIMASQFSAGVQDFKGAGRITQQELNQDAPSQSTMGKLNQDPTSFFKGVGDYRDQLATRRALLFGAAQRADDPRLSDEDYAKHVMPSMDIYGGPKRNIPDFSKMNAADADTAYEGLKSGQVFVDADGQPKRKP